MAVVSRRVYLYGGVQGNGIDETLLDDFWVLKVPPVNQVVWTRIDGNSVGPRAGHALIGGEGTLLLLGGVAFKGQLEAMKQAHMLDVNANTKPWKSVSASEDVLYSSQASAVLGTTLYVYGGAGRGTTFAEMHVAEVSAGGIDIHIHPYIHAYIHACITHTRICTNSRKRHHVWGDACC
jgi:hypothetical protein